MFVAKHISVRTTIVFYNVMFVHVYLHIIIISKNIYKNYLNDLGKTRQLHAIIHSVINNTTTYIGVVGGESQQSSMLQRSSRCNGLD